MVASTQANIKRLPFYAADIASIAAGATHSTASQELNVEGLDHASVEIRFTGGNAAAAGKVTVHLALSTDGTSFSTETLEAFVMANGTAAVRSLPNWIDLRQGVRKVKVLSIVNADAYAISAVNVHLSAIQ